MPLHHRFFNVYYGNNDFINIDDDIVKVLSTYGKSNIKRKGYEFIDEYNDFYSDCDFYFCENKRYDE
ncbi:MULTISPECIES: hypothetical protein [Thermoanaerobacterium]|uniref:Uncharacterized protein n=2 Tax=Thermoanaerobacterium TaxID=28895 RepID=W9E9M4_9THEO|nr:MULTISPECIES: hypothetical protein [Thermoanaerobacterium]AFK85992.1 hypothetical protein Tsac_0976 [Thermoanaerobacterium saccharolyticum JW/SL-YS485]ETO38668.1 hypothetical protein V518_1090 [Thermoanaerobacterium aotearoense SCUT27]